MSERRAAVRYLCHLATPARIILPNQLPPWIAWVYNLSDLGVGLQLEQPIAPQTLLELELVGTGHQKVQRQAVVVHATPRYTGRWLVGCRLMQPLTAQEMDMFF